MKSIDKSKRSEIVNVNDLIIPYNKKYLEIVKKHFSKKNS